MLFTDVPLRILAGLVCSLVEHLLSIIDPLERALLLFIIMLALTRKS